MDKIPNHIAIIPDGNRRWAKAHRFGPTAGHEEGVKRFWEVSAEAAKMGVKYLTIWAGSYDNLTKRSKLEIDFLMKLLRTEILNPKLTEQIHANKTRVRIIGEWRKMVDKKTLQLAEQLEKDTAHYTNNNLTLLFGYDGQREMVAAVNALVKKEKTVTEKTLHQSLWTGELPEVDLVIRTGGEPHWSAGFMMWHTANSQFYFTDLLWPDFKIPELKKAIVEYDRRERRLGS